MKLYFTDYKGGSRRELTLEEAREHLSEPQIEEGREALLADPLEDVSCMTKGGYIHFELD